MIFRYLSLVIAFYFILCIRGDAPFWQILMAAPCGLYYFITLATDCTFINSEEQIEVKALPLYAILVTIAHFMITVMCLMLIGACQLLSFTWTRSEAVYFIDHMNLFALMITTALFPMKQPKKFSIDNKGPRHLNSIH